MFSIFEIEIEKDIALWFKHCFVKIGVSMNVCYVCSQKYRYGKSHQQKFFSGGEKLQTISQ